MTIHLKLKGSPVVKIDWCTLSEACSGVNWADLMAARAPLGPIFMTGLPER